MFIPSIKNIKGFAEFPFFLIIFANMFADTVNTNLVIYRTCYVTLNYNETDCAQLGANYTDDAIAELEKTVQPHTTIIFTISAIMQAVFPPLLCFFFGPWSDVYGRKPVLLTAISGCTIGFVIILIVSAIPSASPWFLLMYSLPNCLFGGIPALLTGVLCYITDATSEENRGVRMGVFESMTVLGTVIGILSSSFVLNACGYSTVYAICVGCAIIAWLYTFLLIPESVSDAKNEGKLRGLFKFSLVKSAIKTTLKKRKYYNRALLMIVTLILILAFFTTYGNKGVLFLFLRLKFTWTLEKFTLFYSITDAIGIIGALVGILLLQKVLHIGEGIIILIGFLSTLFSVLFQGLATEDWHIYVAGLIKCLGGAISPMARCLLSKLIPAEDSGKVFSLLSALETIAAVVGVTIYTNIYNSTLAIYPEAFNFVSAGIYAFEIALIIIVLVIQRYHNQMTHKDVENKANISKENT